MDSLELYKFINDNNIEWHRLDNQGSEDILIFPNYGEVFKLNEILSPCLFDDGGVECVMKDGYLAIWMRDICQYYNIDMDNVFKGNGW